MGRKKINAPSKRKDKPVYDGITFDSSLEVYCYKQLKANNIDFKYTATTYILTMPFTFISDSYEPDKKRGLLLSKRSPKMQPIKYTPDFVGNNWIIETKGRANESWPLRLKLFKKFLTDNSIKYALFIPKNQKQVDQCIEIILQYENN